MSNKEVWWKQVPAGVRLVETAKKYLAEKKHLFLYMDDTEWKKSFVDEILSITVDAVWSGQFYGVFTLNLAELNDDETILTGIANHMHFQNLLTGNVRELKENLPQETSVWVLEHITPERQTELEALIPAIARQQAPILFICTPAERKRKRVKGCMPVELTATKLDLQYYAWTLLMGSISDALLEYASLLAVELSRLDVSRCEEICANIREYLEKPLEELDDVQRSAVHAAQVRGVEPAIEYGRMYLIRRLGNRLNAILPFHDEYETTFTEAADVELRHMMYYRNRLNLQPEEMTLLDRLYHARNCISHLGVLDFDVVELLLKDALNWQ